MAKITYKTAGVDIVKADQFVSAIRKITGLAKGPKAFCSLFPLAGISKRYKEPVLVSSTDGVGTKLKLHQKYGTHSFAGIDLVAMNVNDIICSGAKPLFFLDYIACGKLDVVVLKEVIRGINRACKESRCTLIGGETAEMPSFYKKDEYDLAGFGVGIVDKKALIDGSSIEPGDIVHGLPSAGLHSNGFSLLRKVLNEKEIARYKKSILAPTRLYVKPVLRVLDVLRKNYAEKRIVAGIAHITGGAFLKKAVKILPQGLTFQYRLGTWPVPRVFTYIQKKAGLGNEDIFETLNMGIGLMIVVKRNHQGVFESVLKKEKIKAHRIGNVVKGNKAQIS
jgi:phosphoribosylformylglycinamidine cyclo-ligase